MTLSCTSPTEISQTHKRAGQAVKQRGKRPGCSRRPQGLDACKKCRNI